MIFGIPILMQRKPNTRKSIFRFLEVPLCEVAYRKPERINGKRRHWVDFVTGKDRQYLRSILLPGIARAMA